MERTNSSYNGRNSNPIQETEDKNYQYTEVSSFRIIASLLIAILPIIFNKLLFGVGMGFTVILLPHITKNSSEINFTLDEVTWFSSYCFMFPVASVFGGFTAQYTGARKLLIFSFLLYILADLLFYWTDSVAMTLVAQAVVGFSGGISKGPSTTYIAEIMQPKFRSVTMAAMNMMILFGKFFAILLGNFIYWRTQTFIYLGFSTIGFVFIHSMPESPIWLASKNRFEDAEKALARLRGWTTPKIVKKELYSSIMNAPDSLSLSQTISANDSNFSKGAKLKKALSSILDRSFYIPLSIVALMFFFATFSGSDGIAVFSPLIFEEIKSPIDAQIASTIIPALSIVAAFCYIFSVRFLGKRILTLASVFIETLCLMIAATLLYLIKSNFVTSEIYSWIISIALISVTFIHSLGIGKVTYFVNSELFPQKLRYVGTGIGCFIDGVVSAIFNKTFVYIVTAVTFPGTLVLFIIINITSFTVMYFILPETEDVTLLQIEKHYVDAKNLKNKN